MIKRIILATLFFIFMNMNSTFAVEYDNSVISGSSYDQAELFENITEDDYVAISAHFTEDGEPMTRARIDQLLQDGLNGQVTEFLGKRVVAAELAAGAAALAAATPAAATPATPAAATPPATPAAAAATPPATPAAAAAPAPTKVPNGNCDYDPTLEGSIADALEKCVVENGTKLVNMSGSLILGGVDADASLKSALMGWIGKIAGFLGLGAMFAIAYGSMKLTLSGGEEDRIKKAKDIIKWGILGFLAIISASLLITIVVNIMYSF